MSPDKEYGKWWVIILAILVVAIIAGGAFLISSYISRSKPVEISLSSDPVSTLQICLSGAIANEGIYTFSENSGIGDIIKTAGGLTEEADPDSIEIHIVTNNESAVILPQKVNINTAEAWLLEALPGIGPTLAQRIIQYRESEGCFQSIEELVNVPGIGTQTLEQIRDKITVVG